VPTTATCIRGMTMDKVDDTSKAHPSRNLSTSDAASPLHQLEHHIEAQRTQLLQAHAVLTCLYEVLLHAEGEDAVTYAEAAHVAANLINKSVEELDIVRISPLIEPLVRPTPTYRVEEPRIAYWR
jgi:hypothetical protein